MDHNPVHKRHSGGRPAVSSLHQDNALLQRVKGVDKCKQFELLSLYSTCVGSVYLFSGYPVMFIIYCINVLLSRDGRVDVQGVLTCAEDVQESSGSGSLESLKQSDEERELRDRTLSLLPVHYRPAVTGVNNNPPDPRGQTGDSSTNVGSGNSTNTNIGSGNSTNTNSASGNSTNTNIASGNSTNTNIASGNCTNTDIASGNSTNTNSPEQTGLLIPFTRPDSGTTSRNSLSHEIADGFINSNSSLKPSNDTYAQTCLAALERRFMAVKNENNLLEKNMRCVHCGRNPRGVTFLPCGHFITCKSCSGPVHACNLCNKNILATVDTYLS